MSYYRRLINKIQQAGSNRKWLVVFGAALVLCGSALWAKTTSISAIALESVPRAGATSVVILDAVTGTEIYGKNDDVSIPPASLTKLVTLHVVYNAIYAKRIFKSDIVTIDRRDCFPDVPYGSSLMYLFPGQQISVLDLMRGAAVASGNDAAFALARYVAGSIPAFVDLMNAEIRALGFLDMSFEEPTGLSELNRVTALGFAKFCKLYLELHPESLGELHSLPYIDVTVSLSSSGEHRTLRIKNRNNLIGTYPGCDGLKTGFINESGYNLAATAVRGNTRFILVSLGAKNFSSALSGISERAIDAAALLDWAFGKFVTIRPALNVPHIRVWFGERSTFAPSSESQLAVTIPVELALSLHARVLCAASVNAPLKKGDRLGEVVFLADQRVLSRIALVTGEAIPAGGILSRSLDAVAKTLAFVVKPSLLQFSSADYPIP